jgi:hypothetical protein
MVSLIPGGRTAAVMYQLLQAFDAVRTGDPVTRVVVLRGGTGSGRTVLLQGLYELVAARQGSPEYWPEHLVPDGADPRLTRDVLWPDEFDVEPGSKLPFLWLALAGRDEEAQNAAFEQPPGSARLSDGAAPCRIHPLATAEHWVHLRDAGLTEDSSR